ncbi:hypothetical protein [Streptomyces sp. NPDC047108]
MSERETGRAAPTALSGRRAPVPARLRATHPQSEGDLEGHQA